MLWRRGKAYAQYLRERVFAASGAGLPVGRIAEAVFVSISNVSKVLGRRRGAGETTPHGHWKTSTFIAGLREGGLVAPAVFDGAINGDLFLAYVEQVLVPTLPPDDVVVMDNLSPHKKPPCVRPLRMRARASGFCQLTAPT